MILIIIVEGIALYLQGRVDTKKALRRYDSQGAVW